MVFMRRSVVKYARLLIGGFTDGFCLVFVLTSYRACHFVFLPLCDTEKYALRWEKFQDEHD